MIKGDRREAHAATTLLLHSGMGCCHLRLLESSLLLLKATGAVPHTGGVDPIAADSTAAVFRLQAAGATLTVTSLPVVDFEGDAIVNSTNERGVGGGRVDGAIASMAFNLPGISPENALPSFASRSRMRNRPG